MAQRCGVCGGTGFEVRAREDGVATASRCACQKDSSDESLLRQARIPRRYDHCTFQNFEPGHDSSLSKAHAIAREWVEEWPAERGLLFHGDPGTGKTHLAVAVALELRRRGVQVLFYEHRELLKALQETFDPGALQRESEVMRLVIQADVLVLDDLGAGRVTEWNHDVMHDLIAQRYNEVRNKMIITTNRAVEPATPDRNAYSETPAHDESLSLRNRVGAPLMSRLYEMCRVVEMKSRDYRLVSQHRRERRDA